MEVVTDDLDAETGRALDRFSYRLRAVESGEELPVLFRRGDIVPIESE